MNINDCIFEMMDGLTLADILNEVNIMSGTPLAQQRMQMRQNAANINAGNTPITPMGGNRLFSQMNTKGKDATLGAAQQRLGNSAVPAYGMPGQFMDPGRRAMFSGTPTHMNSSSMGQQPVNWGRQQ